MTTSTQSAITIATAISIAAAACGADETEGSAVPAELAPQVAAHLASDGVDGEFVQFVDDTSGTYPSYEAVDLCEVAFMYDGGVGEFRIASIAETAERVSGVETRQPFTYYDLEGLTPVTARSPDSLVIRTRGGAISPTGTRQGVLVPFRRDERAIVFFFEPREGVNQGFASTGPWGVFREVEPGRYASETLFNDAPVTAAELGGIVSAVYDALPHIMHQLPYDGAGSFPADSCPPESVGHLPAPIENPPED